MTTQNILTKYSCVADILSVTGYATAYTLNALHADGGNFLNNFLFLLNGNWNEQYNVLQRNGRQSEICLYKLSNWFSVQCSRPFVLLIFVGICFLLLRSFRLITPCICLCKLIWYEAAFNVSDDKMYSLQRQTANPRIIICSSAFIIYSHVFTL